LILNKTKLNHQYNLGKIDKMEIKITDHQKKLLGFDIAKKESATNTRPLSRSSVLTKNMTRADLLKKEEKKKYVETSPLKPS
jgi:hypothetical protein